MCLCVCLSVCPPGYLRNHARATFTNFSVHVAYGRGSDLLKQGDENPRGRAILGVSSPLTMHCNAFAANGIIRSPITSCSRRNPSLCQASANRNPENSERRRSGLSAAKGVMGVQSEGEVRYLRLPCSVSVHFQCRRLFRIRTQRFLSGPTIFFTYPPPRKL